VGFDDVPLAAYLRPSLSSVTQPAQLLGETAVDLALAQVGGGTPAPVVLDARLVPRGSSGAG
jgi:DNA-binding LacI/PurR family transcriptional regulator